MQGPKVGRAVVAEEVGKIVWLVVDGEKTWFRASQGDKGTNYAFSMKRARTSKIRYSFKGSLRRRTLAESVVSG